MRNVLFVVLGFSLLLNACNSEEPPKEPQVAGVEDGEVYSEPVSISIIEKTSDVSYKAIIDNKPYQFGESYGVEGKHTLEVIASNDHASSKKTISFEIDSTPPKIPTITGVKNNEIYTEPVKISLNEKQGVSYEYKLDGAEYQLDQEIKGEGSHTFTVVATKDKNGLSTEKQINFTIDDTTYSKKAFEYFKEIAFGSEYGGSPYIIKWLEDIKIKVNGNPTQEDINTIKEVMIDLEELTPLSFELVESNENINMYFVPQGDFRKYIPGARLGNWAYFRYFQGDKGQINEVKIAIGTFGSDQKTRNHHIREEITQALGLGNDSPKYQNSIFYESELEVLNQDFSSLDEKVIEMLYRPEVKVGMSKEEVTKLFKDRNIIQSNAE